MRPLYLVLAVALTAQPALAQTTQQPFAKNAPSFTDTLTDTAVAALPVALWAITGAVIGAVAWPIVMGTAMTAGPISSTGALMNNGAAIGAVVGGAGYMLTR